jgi:hypothetical protein
MRVRGASSGAAVPLLLVALAAAACDGGPKGCAVTVGAVEPGLYGPYDREPPAEPPRQAAPVTEDTAAIYFAWAFPVVSAGDELVLELSPVTEDGYAGPPALVVESTLPAPQSRGVIVARPEGGSLGAGAYRATLRIEDSRVGVVDFEVARGATGAPRGVVEVPAPPRSGSPEPGQAEGSAAPSGGSN